MLRITYFLWFLLLITACRNSQEISEYSPNLVEKYLTEHSPAAISVKDPIILRFKEGVLDTSEWEDRHFTIKPSIPGKISWIDRTTLHFEPTETLPYNTTYMVELSPKVFTEETKNQKLVLPIRTKKLEFAIQLDEEPKFSNDKATISGNIKSSDWVRDVTVEEMLHSPFGKINWVHSQNGRNHRVTISDIIRGQSFEEMKVVWKDQSPGSSFGGSKVYAISPIGHFEVSHVQTVPETNKIEINFTDELDETQRLEGFFKINGIVENLKYSRDGSVLTVFLQNQPEKHFTFSLNKSIKSAKGKILENALTKEISLAPIMPEVRLIGDGVITPYSDEILFPFEAKGLNAVDVEILKVFSNNMLQYLQNYDLNSNAYYLENVGRIIHQEKVMLSDENNNPDNESWKRYAIDLQKMVDSDPGAIYVVRVGFRKAYTNYPCEEAIDEGSLEIQDPFQTIMRWNSGYEGYQYSHESDPCYPVYYNSNRFIQRNILASNLGIIVKGNEDNGFKVYIRNFNTLEAEAEVKVAFYDFQQQLLLESFTGVDGSLRAELKGEPGFIIAQKGHQYAYVSLKDQASNSLSDFDIGGSEKKDGLDGFIYGERGVWRPGDTMNISFILEDKLKTLPDGYPIEMLVKDSRGKEKYHNQTAISDGNLYVAIVPTDQNDPTGNWQFEVKVGGQHFYKSLKVETVKPNRLKVDLELPERVDISNKSTLAFSSSWLYGAPAKNLKARVEATYSPVNTDFESYKSFEFDDPARKINAITNVVFDQILDKSGSGVISFPKAEEFLPSGRLTIGLRTRVFEPTGEYSEDFVSGIADPYSAYVGVKVPESSWGRKYLSKEAGDKITFVVVDQKGNPIPGRKIDIGLYEAEWNWWYNRTGSNIYRYNQANHLEAAEKATLTTGENGEISWSPEELPGYNYMVRVCDETSGHCSGELFYTSNYEYESNDGAASILKLDTDKSSYKLGEEIELTIPSNLSSKILVSVENGETILEEYWVDGEKGSTKIKIATTDLMTPNVYFHVTLIQEYSNEISELPLRMYGVVSVMVEDPATKLNPKIELADKLQPKKSFDIKVSESTNQEMYYTLAIVDEGLLGLTRQKTPDPWNHFYAKQALGIKTWDIYDQVLEGFGGDIDKYISIGGDSDPLVRESGEEGNRFDPVVRFSGPFKLEKGGTNTHSFTMDNYMGAVRIMVVGRMGIKYGSAEKSVPVTNPLMILPTVPRTVAPKEQLIIPVNVIATDKGISQATVSIEVGPGLKITGNTGKISRLTDKKEDLVFFNVSVQDYQGPTYIKLAANGGGNTIDQQIDFIVENPNPRIYKVIEAELTKGEETVLAYAKIGTEGTNKAVLEISSFPAMNLEKRLDYLIRYPYGCLEQTTSSVFPQLYLDKVVNMNEKDKQEIQKNLQAGISSLAKFQLPSGALAFWKGSREASDWGTSYAGHFILEAKNKGYFVPPSLLNNWSNYQKNKARSWSNPDNYQYENNMQAYRLYVLAKAGETEWAAMNILSSVDLNNTARHVLAAAYIVAGQEKIGEEILAGATFEVEVYQSPGSTFGSELRDRALIVEALLSSGPKNQKNLSAKVLEIARDLGNDNWYSTQTTAFALLAVGKYLSEYPAGSLKAKIDDKGNVSEINDSQVSYYTKDLSFDAPQNRITITNQSEGTLYTRITLSGKADYGYAAATRNNLNISVKYTDLLGNSINPAQLSQGTDFIAEVSVINPGTRGYQLEEMALSQVFPSGWEIRNERMTGNTSLTVSDEYEYQDIRDNAVFTFFDLEKVKTFRTMLTATYAGKYFLPDIQCEAMYDHNILARIPGQWITVTTEQSLQ